MRTPRKPGAEAGCRDLQGPPLSAPLRGKWCEMCRLTWLAACSASLWFRQAVTCVRWGYQNQPRTSNGKRNRFSHHIKIQRGYIACTPSQRYRRYTTNTNKLLGERRGLLNLAISGLYRVIILIILQVHRAYELTTQRRPLLYRKCIEHHLTHVQKDRSPYANG